MVFNKNSDKILIQRSFMARLFHVIVYELVAIFLTTLFLVFIMKENMFKIGALSVIISVIATVWNGIFNYLFDRSEKRFQFSRTPQVRILHAFGFEAGLILFTIPLVALYLRVSLWTAFLLEAGLILFFLPYTYCFNYIYDRIYIWFANRRIRKR